MKKISIFVIVLFVAWGHILLAEDSGKVSNPQGPDSVVEVIEPGPLPCSAFSDPQNIKSCCQERYTISPADDGIHFNAVECCLSGYESPDALSCCSATPHKDEASLTSCPK